MALQQIDLDTVQPNNKRGVPGRTAMTIVNQNSAETEQRVAALEADAQQVEQGLESLESGHQALQQSQSVLEDQVEQERADRASADAQLASELQTTNGRIVGKNLFVNGTLLFWQSGKAFVNAQGYNADQFLLNFANASVNVNRLTLNPSEVPGCRYCMRLAVSGFGNGGAGGVNLRQPIEDVNTLAGKTATVSFTARAGAAGMSMSVRGLQIFGSGGSASVGLGGGGTVNLNTVWTRHQLQVQVPSTAGKTVGARSNLQIIFDFHGNGNYDLAGFQIEEGGVMTALEVVNEAIELIKAQRYFEKTYDVDVDPGAANGAGRISQFYDRTGVGIPANSGLSFKVTKCFPPIITLYNDLNGGINSVVGHAGGIGTVLSINNVGTNNAQVNFTPAANNWGVSYHATINSRF